MPALEPEDSTMTKHTKTPTWREKEQADSRDSVSRPAHEKLVKGLSHPVRTECLTILASRTASPRQLSELLNHDLSNVSYHVRVLQELGLIELVGEEPEQLRISTKQWNDPWPRLLSGSSFRGR
jgi:DNA-binding transcriptional ArsR family regulator